MMMHFHSPTVIITCYLILLMQLSKSVHTLSIRKCSSVEIFRHKMLSYPSLSHYHHHTQTYSSTIAPTSSRKSSLPMIIDPNTVVSSVSDSNTIQDGIAAFESSFISSFKYRVIGGVAGTLLAGVAFTTLSVGFTRLIWKSDNKRTKATSTDISNKGKKKDSKVVDDIKMKPSIPPEAWIKLVLCLAVDLGGDVSTLVPGVGELEDTVWAPVAALVTRQLFDNSSITSLEFILQALPLGITDAVPVATIAWLCTYVWIDSPLSKLLKISSEKK